MLRHTDQRYEDALKHLTAEILRMAGIVETMIGSAMRAVIARDSALAGTVITQDPAVNQLEMTVDEQCLELLALHQPAASDLRFIAMGFRISKDLERMADLAVNIAQRAQQLNQDPPLKPYVDLPAMGQKVQAMVKASLDAFVQRDAIQAGQVCKEDDVIDQYNQRMFGELVTVMQQSPDAVARGTRLMMIIRDLERIADHATNIAEEVIFMVQGRDIRHRQK